MFVFFSIISLKYIFQLEYLSICFNLAIPLILSRVQYYKFCIMKMKLLFIKQGLLIINCGSSSQACAKVWEVRILQSFIWIKLFPWLYKWYLCLLFLFFLFMILFDLKTNFFLKVWEAEAKHQLPGPKVITAGSVS